MAKYPSSWKRLATMLAEDRRDLAVVLVYSLVTSLLWLAVPLAAQALVNIVAVGLSLQPLVVLTMAVFGGLFFAGLLTLLRLALVERMRERIFARVALRLSQRLTRVSRQALAEQNPPELMNRFFDVVNVQKSWFKLVFEGPGALFEVMVGLSLLALYGPQLLAFALALAGAGFFILTVLGLGGIRTSLAESSRKYEVAEWLEETARCHTGLKLDGHPDYWIRQADQRVANFIRDRRRHFAVILRQFCAHYLLGSLALAGMLGLGGWMVINRQLTLGQLVAAELVVWGVLKASDKLIRLVEPFYDLHTGLAKVGYITALPVDRQGGRPLPDTKRGAALNLRSVSLRHQDRPALERVDLQLASGQRVALLGSNGSGKSTLLQLMAGLLEPDHGSLEIDEIDLGEVELSSLWQAVSLASARNEIFEGSLEENIHMGRDVGHHELRRVLSLVGLQDDFAGLSTRLASMGRNLSDSQLQRVLLARALVESPRLLLLDDPLPAVDEPRRVEIYGQLLAPNPGTTVVATMADPEAVRRCDLVVVLSRGCVVGQGDWRQMVRKPDSALWKELPHLARGLEEFL
ncbi:MAG: ATP-binding cassette domain-containing protein [Vulcanimicrobiota bacterium]